MKKLIVLSVVFALVASAAFAVDLSASIFALVTPVQGDSDSDDISASGEFKRIRFDGYGEVAEGAFGGWIRFDGGFNGYAFWKPIDQLKIVIGGNPDGMYGKEGVTGWMFHENPYDIGAALGGNNVWGWGAGWPWGGDPGGATTYTQHKVYDASGNVIDSWYEKGETGANPGNGGAYNLYGQRIVTRDAFFGGFGGNALHLNITPFDVLTVNLVLPFWGDGTEIVDAFLGFKAQVDLNFDFGNIAVTYDSNPNGGKIYAYYGGPIGPLGLDVGFAYGFDEDGNYSIGAGVGLKFATDIFGIKFRAVTTVDIDYFRLLTELNPYFTFGDKLAVFIGLGLSMSQDIWSLDTTIDFHVNPYIRIGEEWGAQFLAGFQLWSEGGLDNGKIKWGIPIAIGLSF